MASTTFVNVFRVDHGDYMYIPIEVQQQYPLKFVLQEDEVEVKASLPAEEVKVKVEEAPVVKKRGRK